MNGRTIHVLSGPVAALFLVGTCAPATAAERGPVVVVSQDGEGDFRGSDEKPILAAIEKLADTGGTIRIGPGEYVIRQRIVPCDNLTIQGTDGTRLKLASPVLVASPATAGQESLAVGDTSEYAPGTSVEILPPAGSKTFSDGETETFTAGIRRVEPGKLLLAEPLAHAVPEGSRVGYAHNLFEMRGAQKNVRFESLVLDGGRKPDVPMPGHVRRCAILAHGAYSYEKGPSGPPLENLQVVGCRIRNCYGRAVAFYSVVRSTVEGCRIADVADEAIDLDHFCYHCTATDNQIERAIIGVCINDGSYCTVRNNRIDDCQRTGIVIWWWYKCPMDGLNVENLIEGNSIRSPGKDGISIGKRCFRNRVSGNHVEGGIHVVEPDNVVENNTLEPRRARE